MTATFDLRVFIPLVMIGTLLLPPGSAIVPAPPNPHRYTAGWHGMHETDSMGSYSWGPMIADGGEYERLPMVRDWDDLTDQVLSQLTITQTVATLGGNSDWLLLFNEPDLPEPVGAEATIDTVVAAQAIVEALFPDHLLVSPAYSPHHYRDIERVYDRFTETYSRPPRWDALAFHCYFYDAPTLARCKHIVDWYVQKAQEWGIDEVWCTEFASVARVGTTGPLWEPAAERGLDFIDYMDAAGVDRWFWYGYGFPPTYSSALVYEEGTLAGTLTLLGEMYAGR